MSAASPASSFTDNRREPHGEVPRSLIPQERSAIDGAWRLRDLLERERQRSAAACRPRGVESRRASSPVTIAPVPSRTTTSTRTRLTVLRNAGGAAAGLLRRRAVRPQCRTTQRRGDARIGPRIAQNLNRIVTVDRPHRPDRQHLAERRRVDVGVDRAHCTVFSRLLRVDLQRQHAVAAEPEVARRACRSTGVAPGPTIDVARRVAERAEAGTVNAAVLKKSSIVGIGELNRRAVVVGAQRAIGTLRERRSSRRRRARVNGVPDCTVNASVAVQSADDRRPGPPSLSSQRRSGPERSSTSDCPKTDAAGRSSSSAHSASGPDRSARRPDRRAERRGVVHRLRERVRRRPAESARQPAP